MGKWSELPPEIIHLISLEIDNPFDLIHFRSVCSSWRSSGLRKIEHISFECPLPLDYAGGYGQDCHIWSSRVYLLKTPNSTSPQYWLFKLQEKENGEVVLHSLFLRKTSGYGRLYPRLSLDLLKCQVFELAQEDVASYSIWCDPWQCVGEVEERIGFMGLDTKKNEFIVLGMLEFEGLTMYRSVDERWTELKIRPDTFFDAIVSFKGQFYAIDNRGRTTVVTPNLEVNTFQGSRPCDKTRKRWLVKSGDKLLLVEMCTENRRDFQIPQISKIWFEISELDEQRNDWDQVDDVDGRVLFLENYCYFSCLATEIPGFKANSIIFVDMWGGTNLYEHERILVYEFDEQVVRSLKDLPEYIKLFPSPHGWVISNG